MKTYRLASNGMVHTPGIVAWAMNGYRFEDDRPALIKVMSDTFPGIPSDHLHGLLTGDIHHQIEGDAVVFTAPD